MDAVAKAVLYFGAFGLFGPFFFPITQALPVGQPKDNSATSQGGGNGNAQDYDHHYYDYGKHTEHHEYDGVDDLFAHVKTNLTHDPDNAHIYHQYMNYGISQHVHEFNNTGGVVEKVKKFFRRNAAEPTSTLSVTSLIMLTVFSSYMYIVRF